MKDWLQHQSSNFRELIQSGCAEQMPIMLSVPLPYTFIEKALTYTSNTFDKRTNKWRWHGSSGKTTAFRVSATCDGTMLYMSFTCLSTGLSANIYSPVENGRVFNVIVPRIRLNVHALSGRPWNYNNQSETGFVLVASSEVFGILCNGWSGSQPIDSLFTNNTVQRTMITGQNIGIGMWSYNGLRPFIAPKSDTLDEDFIEYRRVRDKHSIHFGVENSIVDRIVPSAIIGVKPEHGRWLLNKAAKTTSKTKGELLIHFREGTPMFFGVSPTGTELSLEYGQHGKAGKRGKYRSYSYSGKDRLIGIARDSIGTKDLGSLVKYSEEMYFGASDTKVVLGWKINDITFLWEHDVQQTEIIHPMIDEFSDKEVTPLNANSFELPIVRDDFRLPKFLQGYDNVEEEEDMTPDEAKLLIRWWNDHVNAEIMAGRKPTNESLELFEKIKKSAQ
tara:strand:- start:171 stop:1508 length:1338 start_codon:yes stop_codon:yes gene_type:complete